jgi:hypothetical protein
MMQWVRHGIVGGVDKDGIDEAVKICKGLIN